jgi:hypothetical protein
MLADEHPPAIRPDKTDYHVKRRRLAGAIRTQQTNHLPRMDRDRNIVHHRPLSVILD